jgi:hypothetical protein
LKKPMTYTMLSFCYKNISQQGGEK